jgi:hypothetical protein
MKRVLTAVWDFLVSVGEARQKYLEKHKAAWY